LDSTGKTRNEKRQLTQGPTGSSEEAHPHNPTHSNQRSQAKLSSQEPHEDGKTQNQSNRMLEKESQFCPKREALGSFLSRRTHKTVNNNPSASQK